MWRNEGSSRRGVPELESERPPGKTSFEVHGYHDTLHQLLRRMHQRRLVALKSIGFVPTASA